MSGLELPALYHWAPAARRAGIRRRGLVPGQRPTTSSSPCVGFIGADGVPVVCLGTDPMWAWNLSGGMNWLDAGGAEWDLWQVWLADTDQVAVRPEYGPRMVEVRVANRIPKPRLRHVASRAADGHRW